mgnify:CR=1 FL=1
MGNILVSVNPYRNVPLYGKEFLERYTRQGINDQLAPHIYALADESYSNARNSALLRETAGNQAIIISGESGAGKTECSKMILRFLTHLNGDSNSDIASKIMHANPILEAFGNAKTVRNDNSSRFGKFVKVRYNAEGTIVGSAIDIFLLEKSRIVRPGLGERNYHIFYALLKSPAEVRSRLRLGKVEDYFYLNQSNCYDVAGNDEHADYNTIVGAFNSLGVDAAIRDSIFDTVAAILHLGNVTFSPAPNNDVTDPDSSSQLAAAAVDNPGEVENAAALLQISPAELTRVLLFREIRMRQAVIQSPLTVERAVNARDTVSKALYAYIFRYLVDTINSLTTVGEHVRSYFIGVLDIFGFENFDVNRFEQLCINHANERLQQFFQKTVFKAEQDLYTAEGIWWAAIDFTDNRACIDVFELVCHYSMPCAL